MVTPRFARHTQFLMPRAKVEEELEHLTEEGIVEPTQFSECVSDHSKCVYTTERTVPEPISVIAAGCYVVWN